jgi:hypothetical protein
MNNYIIIIYFEKINILYLLNIIYYFNLKNRFFII